MYEERKRTTFTQIMRLSIGRARHLVLSKAPTGNYSLAQQLEAVDENEQRFNVFLKNAAILEESKLIEFSDLLHEFTEGLKKN